MRLTATEKAAILSAIQAHDPAAEVYLYGSRARDDLRGGDIDLLVFSEKIDFSSKLDILIAIKTLIGDQKIDLRTMPRADTSRDPFVQSIVSSAIKLEN